MNSSTPIFAKAYRKRGRRKRQITAWRTWGPPQGREHASEPHGAGFQEHGDQATPEVEAHEALEAAQGGAADEEGRKAGAPSRSGGRLLVGFLQFDGRRVSTYRRQQPFHHVAHAAAPPAEDHRRVLPYQPPHPLFPRLLPRVDRQPRHPPPLPPQYDLGVRLKTSTRDPTAAIRFSDTGWYRGPLSYTWMRRPPSTSH
ncbi:hypothetical protein BHM03_00055530 [Ensete ventricosum]|nr:hypothetical protein BHM03_00055530 [Ensete ventricosum]